MRGSCGLVLALGVRCRLGPGHCVILRALDAIGDVGYGDTRRLPTELTLALQGQWVAGRGAGHRRVVEELVDLGQTALSLV